MKKQIIVLFIISFNVIAFSQIAPSKYWVQFTDKNNTPYSINNPDKYLSQKAIDRRIRQNISIHQNDFPVNPAYVDSIKSTNVAILTKSKWFNGVTIYTTDSLALTKISSFSFVSDIKKSATISHVKKDNLINTEIKYENNDKLIIHNIPNEFTSNHKNKKNESTVSAKVTNYGDSFNQLNMIGGDFIHNLGYRGRGMTIAIFDAGFRNVDILPAFDSLWDNNQIIGYRDFVEPNDNIFTKIPHGTHVFSVIGANIPGQIIGSAPEANFWLIRSEDDGSEYVIEEDNWVAAAEFADSVGVDIINSSLGYKTFDDPLQNHSYEDLDGNTTRATIGADIAASKGILVVNSAGNKITYVNAPADGDSVLAVGAVDKYGAYSGFSSIGPTYDGRIKPNVVAQGVRTIVALEAGGVIEGSGTSFSAPIISGMAACLWQAHPELTNMQIKKAIEQSCSQYNKPDNFMGYGIPNFAAAHILLDSANISHFDLQNIINVTPNPFNDNIYIIFSSSSTKSINIELINLMGRQVYKEDNVNRCDNFNYYSINNLNHLKEGIYFLRISSGNNVFTKKLLKTDN